MEYSLLLHKLETLKETVDVQGLKIETLEQQVKQLGQAPSPSPAAAPQLEQAAAAATPPSSPAPAAVTPPWSPTQAALPPAGGDSDDDGNGEQAMPVNANHQQQTQSKLL